MIICRGHRPCSAQVYAFVPTTFSGSGVVQAGGVSDDTVDVADDRRETPGPPLDVVTCAAVWVLLGGRGGVAGRVGVEGGSAARRAGVVGHTVDFAASGGRLGG
jgi:hypothetical protein